MPPEGRRETNSGRRWAAWTLAAAAVAAVTLAQAFPAVFTGLSFYDDTGYMLALIRTFNAHGGLYTQVFSQYGPWYSEFYALACRGLGVPATQDGLRWITVAVWLAGSVSAGALAFRLTGRLVLAVAAQTLGFLSLGALEQDPGHPVSLCIFCVAVAVCMPTSSARGERWRAFGFGLALGALGLVKINLGVFAVAAMGTSWAFGTPRDRSGRLLRRGAGGLLCLLPLLLVRGGWSGSARAFFLTVALAALLALLTVLGRTGRTVTATWRESVRLGLGILGGWTLVWVTVVAVIIATGTRPADLLGGMLLRPLGLSAVFNVEPHVNADAFLAAFMGLAGALGWRFLLPRLAARSGAEWSGRVENGLRAFFLVLVLCTLVVGQGAPLLLPFLWIGLLPTADPADSFSLRVLPLLAAAEFLSLYPVSGGQVVVIDYLEAVTAVLVAAALLPRPSAVPGPGLAAHGGSGRPRLAFGVAALVLVGVFGWRTADHWSIRARAVPLTAPGSTLVRDEEAAVAGDEFLAANLAGQRSFLTLPGMNSLYSWAQVAYPAGPNCTTNFALLTPAEQRVLIEVGRHSGPVALVYHANLFKWWVQHHAPPDAPLVDFLRQECRPLGYMQAFTLLRLAAGPPETPIWTQCAITELAGEPAARQPTGRITVQVPATLKPVSATLIDDHGRAILPLIPVLPATTGRPGSFVLTVPNTSLLRSHPPEEICLRLCDAAGQRLTTVPFFVSAE